MTLDLICVMSFKSLQQQRGQFLIIIDNNIHIHLHSSNIKMIWPCTMLTSRFVISSPSS